MKSPRPGPNFFGVKTHKVRELLQIYMECLNKRKIYGFAPRKKRVHTLSPT